MATRYLEGQTSANITGDLTRLKNDAPSNFVPVLYDITNGVLKFYDRVAGGVKQLSSLTATETLTNKSLTSPAISGKPTIYSTVTALAADGAIDISLGDLFNITKGSAAAITLADPAAGDNGRRITVYSSSAFAHTITLASGVNGAGATDDVVTFTNRAAASITFEAVATKWIVVGSYLSAIA